MRKFLLYLLLLVLGVKYGTDYLFSPEFEAYADRTKEPWTCHFEKFMGNYNLMMSDYDDSMKYYQRTIKRCPKTRMAESAEYGIAQSLEKLGRNKDAATAYADFAEKYKNSERAPTARRASQVLGSP